MKKFLMSLALLVIAMAVAHADPFQVGYPSPSSSVSSLPLRTNLDQLRVYQQLTNNSFYPTINGMTVSYTGGGICASDDGNIYTVANGVADFSTYASGSVLFVSGIASGGAATLSINTGAFNSNGIPLWTVSVGSSGITLTDNRAWVNIGLPSTTSGLLKATSGTISAAIAGQDYLIPTGNGSGLTDITAAQVEAVPTYTTVNGHALSSNITVSASDVGAIPNTGGTVAGEIFANYSAYCPLVGTSKSGNGIKGISNEGNGAVGISISANGVNGISTSGNGVNGTSTSSTGVNGTSASSYGVAGISTSNYAGYFASPLGIYVTSGLFNGYSPYSANAFSNYSSRHIATVTPTASSIPIADVNGTLNSWITSPTTVCLPLAGGHMTGAIKGGKQATFGNISGVFFGSGANLTNLNASNITSGTLAASQGGAGTVNGILKANGLGSVSQANAGTDYLLPNGSGSQLTGITAAQVGAPSEIAFSGYSSRRASALPSQTGNSGLFLTTNGSTASWAPTIGSLYILIQDQKASGTAGGTFTAGAWYTRTLNTIVHDDTGLITLNNNTTVNIPAGWTVRFRVETPAFDTDYHKARLMIRNSANTNYTTIAYGTNEESTNESGEAYPNTTRSVVVGKFSTTVAQRIKIQHRGAATRTTDGMGRACSFGAPEIYTTLELWK